MATIKKKVCDRCGEPIQMIGWTSKLSRKQPCKIDLLKLFNGNLDGYSYSEERYDLCCECTRKLSLFLRNKCDVANNGLEKPMDIDITERKLLKSQSLEEFDQLLQGVDIQAAKGIIKKLVSRLNVLCLEKILDVANEDFDVVEFMKRISEER